MTWLLPVACAAAAGLGGFLVPWLVGRLPEPVPRDTASEQPEEDEGDGDPAEEPEADPEPPKIPYAELATRPGLGWRSALAGAVAGAIIGASVGPDWWLVVLVPLVPVCVALSFIDWHTKLLPTRLVLPATAYALVAVVVGWAVTQQTDDLVRALLGLVVARSFFWVLWFIHSAGMGFGDVRLAALLGVGLGHLGWAELLTGMYAGFLVFGLPGVLLAIVRRDRRLLRTAFPFGPFMLLGALVGVVTGPWIASYLAWG
ncbi:prepilin peptidase [Nocardioides sp. GXQ0305]|uniref:prepilin peptidase n=1 Tax=Nocardioides sp. GXQ0305 TaxID=3423912 RepID=UPI003D7DA666